MKSIYECLKHYSPERNENILAVSRPLYFCLTRNGLYTSRPITFPEYYASWLSEEEFTHIKSCTKENCYVLRRKERYEV